MIDKELFNEGIKTIESELNEAKKEFLKETQKEHENE